MKCSRNQKVEKWQYSSHTSLYSDPSKNPYTVKPSYSFWAPWIGPNCRRSGLVYNTEHRKCHRSALHDLGTDTSDEIEEKQAALQTTPSEEDLLEMMHFAQVTLCNIQFPTNVQGRLFPS